MQYPKISIITVVRNGEKDLESAIKSVVNQSYGNIEYIILDGLSTDGTLDIIRKYEHEIALWKSEADRGIYDAMNRGLDLATGDWAYFLGCDDVLASPTIIEEVAAQFTEADNIYYGNTYLKKRNRLYTGKASKWNICLRNISHQAIFYPKSVYKEKKYNLHYKLAADHVYNVELFGRFGPRFTYMPKLISIYNDLGMSSTNVDQEHKKDIVGIVYNNLGGAVGSYFWLRVKVANFKNSLIGGK
ncbi:Glycosyltransferase involved in cell wall bisynthesis [Dyadobacter sp. SG02]|uniref:glycosyltransferase family 2 protein n=1 Tax=Dyadobacter sp. SG02 TaxID=1855291 RepID=UPI0008BBEEF1|nr:glycosyltransferase family 2 protein [Dyadobacter sp. SG02]SEJ33243.1 Glycosyltransferase involved in cell wall bisynthesis [Dyadobacter sp. SG02]